MVAYITGMERTAATARSPALVEDPLASVGGSSYFLENGMKKIIDFDDSPATVEDIQRLEAYIEYTDAKRGEGR